MLDISVRKNIPSLHNFFSLYHHHFIAHAKQRKENPLSAPAMFSFVPIKCKNEKAREKEEEITKACGKLYDSHKNVIVRIYMLCIIYSMCLFFTLFYRAIFLKSIQLHREMVVCAAQEKKNNKKSPTERNASRKRQKGQQKQARQWHRANKTTESTANGCRSIHLSTQRVLAVKHRPNREKRTTPLVHFDFFPRNLCSLPRSSRARQNKRQCMLWTERNYF